MKTILVKIRFYLTNYFLKLKGQLSILLIKLRGKFSEEDDLDIIANICFKKWGADQKTADLKQKIEKWLEPVEDPYEKQVLIKLLENFDYYTRKRINSILIGLYKKYISNTNNYEFTIYAPIKSRNYKINSSYELLIEFRNLNNINHNSVVYDLHPLATNSYWENILDIVLVDDIAGTGKTITEYFDDNITFLKTKKIHLIVLVATVQALDVLSNYAKSKEIDLVVHNYQSISKAFSKSYIFSQHENVRARETVRNREILLWGKSNEYILGKNESEALTAFVHNTPNNTLSCFWLSNNSWQAPFPRRHDKSPQWKRPRLSEKRKDKNKLNYQIKKLSQ